MVTKKGSSGGIANGIKARREAITKYMENPNLCQNCGKIIQVGTKKVAEIKIKKYCNRSCAAIANNKIPKRIRKPKVTKPKVTKSYIRFLTKTKSEIFTNRSWQAARSIIQKSARFIYFHTNKENKCKLCDYKNHIEVAHIKSVASFHGNAKLYEINHIKNLIGLCPNHHWEFDNFLCQY